MIIVFEGIDRCGKSTQVELLQNALIDSGYDVTVVREPGGTDIGEKIRDILLSKESVGMDSITELLLFFAARRELWVQTVQPALVKGHIVLYDRFFGSSFAYQGHGRGINHDIINSLKMFTVGDTTPDFTFFLDVVDDSSLDGKESNPDRIEMEPAEFSNQVAIGFRRMSTTEPNWNKIDGGQDIEEVHLQVLDTLRTVLIELPEFEVEDLLS